MITSSSGITTFFFKFILFPINKVLLACYANFILLLIHVLAWLPQRCNHIIDHDHVFVSKIWIDPALSIAYSLAVCQISRLIWLDDLAPMSYLYIYIYIYFFLGMKITLPLTISFACISWSIVEEFGFKFCRSSIIRKLIFGGTFLYNTFLTCEFLFLLVYFLFCIVPPPFRVGNMMT